MLTADELADMRETVNESLPDTCTIQSKTTSSDGMGGFTETWANTYTGVPCRVKADNLNPKELVENDTIKGKQTYTITLAHNQTVNSTQRIVWNTQTFEIVAPRENSWQLHKRLVCILAS